MRCSLLHSFIARLLFGVAIGIIAATACSQTVVRVLDYNIEQAVGGDASNTTAQPALAKVINYLDPDVWTINELGDGNGGFDPEIAHDTLVTFINSRLTIFGPNPQEGEDYFVYLGTRDDNYISNAIVSRYPFLSTQTYSDAGSGYSALRGLVRAHVDLPGPINLGVFTAHLKAFSNTSDASRRQAEASADRTNLQNWLAANPNDGAVMTGDFNETEEPTESDNWNDGDIGDTLPNGNTYRPITTLRAAGFADAGPASIAGRRATIDSSSPDSRFDYILHRTSHLTYLDGSVFDTKQHTAAQLSALNAANGTNFVAADSAAASNHLPVIEVFLATPGPALTVAQSVTSLGSSTATLNATINPNGYATAWWLELGTTISYGASSFAQSLPAGTTSWSVNFKVTGLTPGTTYHYRVVTQNSAGTSFGPDRTFVTTALQDSDGDGMPNDWEQSYSLNPNSAADAALDSDGDGQNNRNEYLAGTNPRSATDAFRILSFTRSNPNYLLSWSSIFGKRYQVQTRTDLISSSWMVQQTNIAGTGGVMTSTVSAVGAGYFRVVTPP